MTSAYPGALDTFTNPGASDPQTAPSHSGQHTDANDAIEAIQATLGVDPQGSEADVAARLDALEAGSGGGGLALAVPTSIANSGGSSALSGGKVTFTTVNSISLNGCFSSTYDTYRILLVITAASASGYAAFRFRASGTDNTSNNYLFQSFEAGSTSLAGSRATATAAQLNYIDSSYPNIPFSWDVFSPNLAVPTTSNLQTFYRQGGSTTLYLRHYAHFHDVSSAFDGITLYPASGTFTGTVRVYGYQNS